jgi:hypothetical protein
MVMRLSLRRRLVIRAVEGSTADALRRVPTAEYRGSVILSITVAMFDISGKIVAHCTLPVALSMCLRRTNSVDGIKAAITGAPVAMAFRGGVSLGTGSTGPMRRGLRRRDNHGTGFFLPIVLLPRRRDASCRRGVRSLVQRLQQGVQLEGVEKSAASIPLERHRPVRHFLLHLRLHLEARRPWRSHSMRAAMANPSFPVTLKHGPRHRLRCLLTPMTLLYSSRMLPG